MKRYLVVLMAILVLAPVLLVGCAQEAGLESRVVSLERKLTAAESTIEELQQRIFQLNRASLTEADILRTLEGKGFRARLGSPANATMFGWTTGITIEYFFD